MRITLVEANFEFDPKCLIRSVKSDRIFAKTCLYSKLYANSWRNFTKCIKRNRHLELEPLIENNEVLRDVIENYEKSEIRNMIFVFLVVRKYHDGESYLHTLAPELVYQIAQQYNGLVYNSKEKICELFRPCQNRPQICEKLALL